MLIVIKRVLLTHPSLWYYLFKQMFILFASAYPFVIHEVNRIFDETEE